ncbi:MAG: GTP-binding protein [Marinagarivorans sp.]|nr:GTP-binding protein [Marinagarivorans sp.]
MMLEGRDEYEFLLTISTDKPLAIFTQHTPEEFDLKLMAKNDVEHTPLAEHFFNAEHSHDSAVSSVAVEMPGLFDMSRINAWLDVFLQVHGEDVYRMKGVVGVKGEDCRFVFQGVHMIFGGQAGKPWGNETPINRMVFIGKHLDERYIRSSLESCLV